MITSLTLTRLHLLRKEHCTCGFDGVTPEYHELKCPYVPYGVEELQKAEKEEA